MKNNNGYTVLEIMMVMVITAAIAAIAVPPLLQWRNSAKANSAVSEVYGVLQKAKSRAIRERTNISVLFDANNKDYSIDGSLGIGKNSFSLPGGIRFTSSPDVTFTARGILDGGAALTIDLNTNNSINISRLGVIDIQ